MLQLSCKSTWGPTKSEMGSSLCPSDWL